MKHRNENRYELIFAKVSIRVRELQWLSGYKGGLQAVRRGSIPGRGKKLSLLEGVQIGSMANSASYPLRSFLGGKQAEE
jgi:hypothetical protein